MGAKFTIKTPLPLKFNSHKNDERVRVQALGLASTLKASVETFLGDSSLVLGGSSN